MQPATAKSMAIGIWDYNVSRDEIRANDHLAGLFALNKKVASLGAPLSAYLSAVHAEDVDRMVERLKQAASNCGVYSNTYQVRDSGGDLRTIHAQGFCYLDARGEVRLPGTAIDLTTHVFEDGIAGTSSMRDVAMTCLRAQAHAQKNGLGMVSHLLGETLLEFGSASMSARELKLRPQRQID
jgi:hypothetical protein